MCGMGIKRCVWGILMSEAIKNEYVETNQQDVLPSSGTFYRVLL